MDFDLQRLPLFADLSAEQIKPLQTITETIRCEAGEFVVRQNSPADYFYIIIEGKAQISFEPYDGDAFIVSQVERGGVFGWSAVIGSERYSSSTIVVEPLEALRIRGDDLRKLIEKNPAAGREILNCLANAVSARYQDAHERVKLILKNGMK